MKSFSFIFAGTSEIALDCLKLLIQSESLKLKAVLTRLDVLKGRGLKTHRSEVKVFAENHQFPTWSPHSTNEASFLKTIQKQNCDFSFVCSYGKILPSSYLKIFPKGCINLHFSLLPKWRGAAPVQRALMAGDSHTGVSLQVMNEKLDCGDLIGLRKFEIKENDNAQDIFKKSIIETKSLLNKELIFYLTKQLQPQPQNSSQQSYAYKIDKKESKIVWTEPSIKIHNKIRALFLGPQAFDTFKDKRIKIYRSQVAHKIFPGFTPGTICYIEKNTLTIACGQGSLNLLEVQQEGKKRQKIEDFLKGFPIKLRDSFC